jgi:hypothetical protein
MDTIDRNTYGAIETAGLVNGFEYHQQFANAETVLWSDKRLAQITRLRLVSDPGFPYWDVSYIHGILKDGTPVRVQNPFDQLPKRGLKGAILEQAKRDGVYAKGLGVFDNISTLC